MQAINWPRSLLDCAEFKPVIERLSNQVQPIAPKSGLLLPKIALSVQLAEVLLRLSHQKRLERGLELITSLLAKEQRGLDARKDGAGSSQRISRLILFTNDGSPRFYREVEKLLTTYNSRVFACGLAVDSAVLGEKIFGKGRFAKVILLNHKEAVAKTLLAM